MKKTLPHLLRGVGAAAVLTVTALSARASVTMQLDRNDIGSDETAELTVQASGSPINPPSVAGLQFTPVSQSSQVEIINGSVNSTSSVIYEVVAQAPGNYTIPTADGSKLTLHVRAGSGPSAASSAPAVSTMYPFAASPAAAAAAPSLPTPALQGATASTPHMVANGAAFMRMEIPKKDLYVGENVPVDIQVGLRSGMAAQLNGLPTLSADAFTLNKLTTKPEESEQDINGQPYTILTWHSIMAAVKPGEFSLSAQTPVTVQVRTRAPQMSGMNDMFNDPFFQNFFGGTTEKELTLSNEPTVVKVLPLPTNNQPANFSGAVGNFTASSEISATTGTVGEPLTLRLKINGTGAFDRVASPVLASTTDWKTYRASSKFVPADSVGYQGEKDFEQAIIPTHAGAQTVPAITFAYFNPETAKYEEARTIPIHVEIAPGSATAAAPAAAAPSVASNTPTPAVAGTRPDMTETGSAIRTLRPLYFQPGFVAAQASLALAFVLAGTWMRRNNRLAADPLWNKRQDELKAVHAQLVQMDTAAQQHDAATFFFAAREAVQHAYSSRWKMSPHAITLAEIDSRLNGDGENVRRVFALADELAYSGGADFDVDFNSWKQAVHQIIKQAQTI
jgi:hypothetical protein